MRHGFETLAGNHAAFGDGGSFGDGGTTLLWMLLIVAALVAIALLSEYIRRRNHPEHKKLLQMLKEKYANHEINEDEYRERSMILEDEYWLDSDDPAMMTLKERYARCEIDTREYVKRREELKEMSDKSPSASFKEGPAI